MLFAENFPPKGERDLNDNIPPTCIISSISVSANEKQTFLALTENSTSFIENSAPVMAKSTLFAENLASVWLNRHHMQKTQITFFCFFCHLVKAH